MRARREESYPNTVEAVVGALSSPQSFRERITLQNWLADRGLAYDGRGGVTERFGQRVGASTDFTFASAASKQAAILADNDAIARAEQALASTNDAVAVAQVSFDAQQANVDQIRGILATLNVDENGKAANSDNQGFVDGTLQQLSSAEGSLNQASAALTSAKNNRQLAQNNLNDLTAQLEQDQAAGIDPGEPSPAPAPAPAPETPSAPAPAPAKKASSSKVLLAVGALALVGGAILLSNDKKKGRGARR